jgi:hypothetical protein
MYQYIKQRYGLKFAPKMRVQHTVTNKFGEVRPEEGLSSQYVSVRFDGLKHDLPCHPEELTVLTVDAA